MMKLDKQTICPEAFDHAEAIEFLQARALGPGRHTLTASRLRQGEKFRLDLSWVHLIDAQVIASVRFNTIWIGATSALLLGPLVVDGRYRNFGYGRSLVTQAMDHIAAIEPNWVLLVGDEAYYQRCGFAKCQSDSIQLPGPVDPARLLLSKAGQVDGEVPSGMVSIRRQ